MNDIIQTVRTILLCALVLIAVHHAGSSYAETDNHPEKAPDFELNDVQGVKHRLSAYHGRVVLINFWASWCKECIAEIPSLNTLYERYRDKNVVVLGVSIDRNNEDIERSMGKFGIAYPVLVDRKGEVFIRKYTVIGLPTTVIVDKNGYIADRLIGRSDFSSAAFLNKLNGLSGEKPR
ncbi:MAG: TlpA family protein disulfide reductase [Nitrospirota bacterium]|nr:TlpA family protein disulfide reductase [Nitrospirota bacterium]